MTAMEDIGLLNEAGLWCGEMAALVEEASQLIDRAEAKMLNVKQNIDAVRGEIEIRTLVLCASKALECLEACRGVHNQGVEAILAGNTIQDMLHEYVRKLHS